MNCTSVTLLKRGYLVTAVHQSLISNLFYYPARTQLLAVHHDTSTIEHLIRSIYQLHEPP